MRHETINRRYFLWIYHRVFDETSSHKSYYQLIRFLYDKPFRYNIPMDANREEDGFNLRYRFADEEDIDKRIVASEIDFRPCSVLEMMTALAIRCEEQIMSEPNKPDRTGTWFQVMIHNLGVDIMDDENFDPDITDAVVERFLDGKYSRNGKGGLFYVPGIDIDMRRAEIWYQMNWYMNKIIETEDINDE